MSLGQEKSTQPIYTGSLLSQELHPVPRNHWVFHYAIKTILQTPHTKVVSDLEPLKKHTTFGKSHQEC